MTLTIKLDREVEDKVQAQAAARGLPVKKYVEDLVREVANGGAEMTAESVPRPSVAEFDADWAAFAEGLDHVPPLPPEAFSREAMYVDHD